MYEIGDFIVKPSSGVCEVKDITHLDMTGVDRKKLYYMLVPIEDTAEKIYLPTDTADMNVRSIMTAEEVKKLIDTIDEVEELYVDNEKQREQIYKESIRSCKPDELLKIIKTTYLRKKARVESGRKSTIVDERYFKMAENVLYSEMGFVLGKSKEDVKKLIEDSVHEY